MSIKLNDLSVLAYANNFTLWHYKAEHKLTTMLEANYFNNAADMMNINDMIIVNADIDEQPVNAVLFVTGINQGIVEVKQFA